MSSYLIKGRHVIRGAPHGDEARVIADGAVLVREGVIAAVGKAETLEPAGGFDRVLGGADHVVFPGFVNSHHHVGLTPFQLGSPDLPLELWIARRIGGRVPDLYLDTLYSGFEMVRSGVTCVQHLHGRVLGSVEDAHRGAKMVIQAYQDLGLRVSYSFAIRDQNRLVYAADEEFLARLPADLAGELRAYLASQTLPLEDYFVLFEGLTREFADDDRVAIQLAPANLHWCSDAALERIVDVMRESNVPIHMHLLETPYQKAYALRRTGGSAVRYLGERGLLGPLATLGHGTWTSEDDLDEIAETGTRICHNCSSNMRLRSGTAPLIPMLERGIEVAIGIDEAGINDDRDMLQELRMVLEAHRVTGHDGRVPTPEDVFRMATEFGARTTPFGDRIGVIEEGRSADLVLSRWSQFAFPYLDPDTGVVDAIVHRGKPAGVESVLVAGELVLDEGRIATLDEQGALTELAQSLSGPATDDGCRLREIAKRLVPHVSAFYAGYLDDLDVEPYYARQSARR
ncbi:MAG: amidohydrolase family protein [Rhodospirillales bacterium]|jgi:cytosine/adenosine deaminase-related metal-dependent hydrolase|nr:amidohydrolase family protein [Rhodospirillales bacterium]